MRLGVPVTTPLAPVPPVSWYVKPLLTTDCVTCDQLCMNVTPNFAACEPVTYEAATRVLNWKFAFAP